LPLPIESTNHWALFVANDPLPQRLPYNIKGTEIVEFRQEQRVRRSPSILLYSAMNLKSAVYHAVNSAEGCVVDMSDVNSRIQQIATVLEQLQDSQVPRNIRKSAKDATTEWLLNEDKDMDVRLGMTASKLDEIFNDANLPIHFGPLCLQIQTALEALLREVQ
tara:strand:- start:1287 stop:1775 length:489 start_codon:yes stop_codon:yes gene_type:complete